MSRTTDFAAAPRSASQIVLDLPASEPRLTRADYVVGESNEGALLTIEAWASSNEPLLVICGPKGSGKTHLAQIVAAQFGAIYEPAASGDDLDAAIAPDAIIVYDATERAGDPEKILAAIANALAGECRLVFVGRGEPGDWSAGLKDLETRLNAAPRITLAEPDEALLRAVMAKLFSDRQLRPTEGVADYAVKRLPKTFAAASAFVAAVDAASMQNRQPIGLKLAREIVANLSEAPSEAY